MENALGEDLPVEIYRSYDKIKNLKIRVKVRKIPNACFTEKDSLTFGDTNEIELMNLMKASAISDECEFRWQEKVEKTKDRVDGTKSKEDASKKNSLSICLFSYIDSDITSPMWKHNSMSCTYPSSQPSHLEERMMKLKPRTRLKFSDGETWQKPFFSNVKKLVKTSNLNDSLFPVGQSMVLMAALFFEDSQTSEEIELCYLQLDDNGSLIVIPDFNKRKSYTFVDSRSETFEYELENISNNLTSSALQREKNLIKKIAAYKNKLKGDTIGTEFNKPEPENTCFVLNCEIVSASDFSSSNIFVHYLVVLPRGLSSEDSLEGVTQTCHCKSTLALYGHTFSMDISADNQTYNSDEPVKIIFDITSVDHWGNFRNEGYGYTDITLIPGIHFFDVYTWKIEPSTLRHKLQHFFIGGMPHLEDLSYVINSKEAKDSQLSRYGVLSKTSGRVSFKSYVLLQKVKTKFD